MGTTKTQIEVDFDTNEALRSEVNKQRKFENSEITKERHIGIMVENQFKLQQLLQKKKMTFDDLLISLKAK